LYEKHAPLQVFYTPRRSSEKHGAASARRRLGVRLLLAPPQEVRNLQANPEFKVKAPARSVTVGGSAAAAVDRHGLGHARRRSRPSPPLRPDPCRDPPATTLQRAYLASDTQRPGRSQTRLTHPNGYQHGATTGSSPALSCPVTSKASVSAQATIIRLKSTWPPTRITRVRGA
jgi:hypothetical protein